jgi:sugar lactone lactonase YvrE
MNSSKIAHRIIIIFALLFIAALTSCAPKEDSGAKTDDFKPSLFLTMPDYINTPDGMTMGDDGNIILACPNYQNREHPGVLLKIDKKNNVSLFYTPDVHPETKRTCPMGLDFGPDGNLYFADNQYFDDTNYKSRLIRVVIEDGAAVRSETAVDGFKLSNAVIWKGNDIYVSDTFFDLADKPGASGIYKISLDEMNKGTVQLKPNATDPHLIAQFVTVPNHRNDSAGADGLTFDSEGNLYTGMFGDGVMYKITFDKDGNVATNTEFVNDPEMPSVDGIFYDKTRDIIYVTDSERNAIHTVTTSGKRTKIWENDDTDGADGLLDQPCEPLVRGNELILVNFDIPFPGLKNTVHDEYHTVSVIKLGK